MFELWDGLPDSYPMAVTLNKDGKPRKVGSGKTKGAGCFEKISWSALKGYVGEEVEMPISRVWLRSIGASVEVNSKTRAKKTKSVTQTKEAKAVSKKKILPNAAISKPTSPSVSPPSGHAGEDYDPPPLFASDDGIRNY